jgi:hypothetical protein
MYVFDPRTLLICPCSTQRLYWYARVRPKDSTDIPVFDPKTTGMPMFDAKTLLVCPCSTQGLDWYARVRLTDSTCNPDIQWQIGQTCIYVQARFEVFSVV